MYIYKITNRITNQAYIGFSSKNNLERMSTHHRKGTYYVERYKETGEMKEPHHHAEGGLYFEMRKYGLENFDIQILCSAKNTIPPTEENIKVFHDIEQYFIVTDSKNQKLYNRSKSYRGYSRTIENRYLELKDVVFFKHYNFKFYEESTRGRYTKTPILPSPALKKI